MVEDYESPSLAYDYKFTGSSQYTLNENNYIIAVKEDSYFADRNVVPLCYITENYQDLEIDEEEIGNKILVSSPARDTETEDITVRFYKNELFKICRGQLKYNEKHDYDYNLPKKWTFKSNLQHFSKNEIIELFEGTIDSSKTRILLKDKELINERYFETHQAFFVIHQERIIGPFTVNSIDDEGYFLVDKSKEFKFGEYKNDNKGIIEVNANNLNRKIIVNKSVFKDKYIKEFDFISDKGLVAWFNEELMSQNEDFFNQSGISLVLQEIEKASKLNGIIGNKERAERISRILSNTKEKIITKQNLLKVIPEYQGVKEELEQLEFKRLEIRNALDQKEAELEATNSKIIDEEKALANLKNELEELKNQVEVEQNRIRENIKNEISELERRKQQLDTEIEKERSNKSEELDRLKKEIEYKEHRHLELKTAIDALKKDFTSEQKSAQEKLSELVKQNTHFNFISGRDLPSDNSENSHFNNHIIAGESISTYRKLRDGIHEILKSQQRSFENHFIDNLLISIHQNTLTLFAGLPGTGKTSLAKIFTSALTVPERIKEIPVARGWTSQKDLIGFSNPLTKKFHEAPTGLYQLLKQLDYEWDNGLYLDSPLAYVILDEANLSPLEHYWSIFNNTTDSFATTSKPLSINLGQSEIIRHANALRFIGTINYDQTTEELSPRILDRTNIIRLMPNQFQIENISSNEIESLKINLQNTINLFNLFDFKSDINAIQMPEKLGVKYESVKKIFNKLNIYISPRVDIAIKRYCSLASTIMTEESRPLDYCIAQRLLPLINIQSNKKSELEELLAVIQSLSLDDSVSANILTDIIKIGSAPGYTQDSYSYFLTLNHV
ncbi:hypothetical protein [Pontibacter vulgaris]|uniref:hypothetical protein n=1 Tax=Pontibacter vulgaris TaxID=2905679 RepID=UPI001FA752F0|nr:hypothetical protein [Pontibacter vulgaris]